MLTNLSVIRFKSLVNLDLDLGRVNVFVGANGSGKSNLLEALGVLAAAAYGRVDDESLLRRGVRPGVPRLYKTAFPLSPKENVPISSFGPCVSPGPRLRSRSGTHSTTQALVEVQDREAAAFVRRPGHEANDN